MFTLIHGNRQEALARHLAGQLKTAPLPLFEREIIVVQSSGMARWLQLVLAEELGLATQLRFAFPAAYLWELFGTVLPDVPRDSPFSSDILTWQLLRLVQSAPDMPEFAPLRHYLADGVIEKRHGLARKLAECFENYLAYRPDWTSDWLAGKQRGLGEHETWQAWLWRKIAAERGDLPKTHPAELFFRALENDKPLPPRGGGVGERGGVEMPATLSPDPSPIKGEGCLVERLPSRITLFGSGAMPPPYLDIFKQLGNYIDVVFYLVNPCREHWGELVSKRAKARAALETPEILESFEVGQPLLGSLGGMTRVVFERLMGNNDEDIFIEPADMAESPPGGRRFSEGLLRVLHADLLNMKSRLPDERLVLKGDDDSIQFHVCHGAMREVEVLHDRLLALFEADPTLQPHDVLVLTPDLPAIAPLVEAVFSTAGKSIHYTVADRPLEGEAPLLRAFNKLLALPMGRFDAESVLALLEESCVAARFGFDADALDMARAWVAASGIRWGLSADSRAARGLPAEAMHTWRWGLKRMLLGVALPQKENALFQGVLPFDAVEGVRTHTLGKLMGFIDALSAAMEQLSTERSLAAWAELLPQLCHRFCIDEARLTQATLSDQRALQALRSALRVMEKNAASANFEEALPLAVIRRELDASLSATPPSWAFLGGGVTFAALRAYRAVPARVICMIGMNDGAFPRNPALPGFDLLHKHPRAGDRDLRAEDRHAFFEALLSARDCLHLSYVGRGVRDNAPQPPSTLIAELIDSLDAIAVGEHGKASAQLIVEHRLQPFSPRYFDGSDARLYSYEAGYAQASAASVGTRRVAQPFIVEPLPEPPAELLQISPENLLRFFRNPAEHLLRKRLGIHLEESEGLIDTVEPFGANALERFRLRSTLVEEWQAGVTDAAQAVELAAARGDLPHGAAGRVQFAQLWEEFSPFAQRVEAESGKTVAPCVVDFRHDDVHLTGGISGLRQSEHGIRKLLWRVGKIRAQDRLLLWLGHVMLHAAGISCESVLLTPEEECRFAPLPGDSADLLHDLLAIYKRGCSELLPFFPATSLAWLKAERGDSRANWLAFWEDGPYRHDAESANAYVRLAFPDAHPFTMPFAELAKGIYAPMLDHEASCASTEPEEESA